MNRHPQVQWIFWQPTTQGFVARCQACGVGVAVGSPQEVDAFAAQHQQHQSSVQGYYGAGDLVARATGALGLKHCTPCEARQHQLNQRFPRLWRR